MQEHTHTHSHLICSMTSCLMRTASLLLTVAVLGALVHTLSPSKKRHTLCVFDSTAACQEKQFIPECKMEQSTPFHVELASSPLQPGLLVPLMSAKLKTKVDVFQRLYLQFKPSQLSVNDFSWAASLLGLEPSCGFIPVYDYKPPYQHLSGISLMSHPQLSNCFIQSVRQQSQN